MPIIRIMTLNEYRKLDLKKALEEIAAEMEMEPERLNLFEDQYPTGSFYRASGNKGPIIQISARRHNGEEWIHHLMDAAARAVAKQLNVDATDVIVYTHPIEDNFLRMNGKFI